METLTIEIVIELGEESYDAFLDIQRDLDRGLLGTISVSKYKVVEIGFDVLMGGYIPSGNTYQGFPAAYVTAFVDKSWGRITLASAGEEKLSRYLNPYEMVRSTFKCSPDFPEWFDAITWSV